ncbi:hypothetical protein [Kitasatospora cinereorecta]|uniref:Uncharacterized protein n=1 Tax=Kitasatospora cinereorecta TaxID=285560 RepID=A0ABW0VR78_9ACTN
MSRPVSLVLKLMMIAPLAVAAGYSAVTLTLAPTATDSFFAWRMSPVTAVLLGAGYGGACTMLALALGERRWERVRVAVAACALLMPLMLGATLLGRGTLHLLGGSLLAFASAWIWLAVHLAAPPIGLIALGAQWRVRGPAPTRAPRLPWWVALPMAGNGTALAAAGFLLYLRPDPLARHWPWQAGPLDVRVLGAWCLTFGAALLLSLAEAELRRVRSGMTALVATGLLGLVGLIRYGDHVSWTSPGAWLVLLVLLTLAGLGLCGFGISWMLDPAETRRPLEPPTSLRPL